jgi:PAS domain S-box-containing protein
MHDTEGRFVDLNPAACEILGLPRDAAIGLRLEDLADGLPVRWNDDTWRAVEEGTSVSFEQRIRRADGRILTLDVRARLLPDGFVEAISRDVTAQRESEAERDRLARAAAQTSDSIVITDLEGTIVYVNAAFEQSTGYSRETVLGENPRILRSGKQDAVFYRTMWETITAGQVWSGELVNRRSDGSLFREAVVIGPVRDAAGQVVNYVGVKRDITRVRELEERLAQAAKMEAIGQLAGGIAHDFNNILTAIGGYAALVQAAVPEGTPVASDVRGIVTAAARAQTLTSQLLAFGRRQVLEPRPIDVRSVVAGVRPMLARLIGEDIALTAEAGGDPCAVSIDAGRLEHALVNLVVNARNAMPDGGSIRITVERVPDGRSEGLTAGPWVVLGVADTGSGMTAEVAARIFEPFYTTHEQGEGTGLGLAMVDGFIRQSGGEIRVVSGVGRGTTFRIFLPAFTLATGEELLGPGPQASAEATVPLAEDRNGSSTILVVEDEPVLRMLAERALTRAGYRVFPAGDGDEALQFAAGFAGRIDLLFSDVIMPGLRGSSLAEALRASRPEIRVLLTSGYTEDDVMRRGIILGRDGFLPKPYTPQALTRAVSEVLG